jgi:acyl dehydratase
MNMATERYWDDAKVGDEAVSPTMTVTGAMIDMYADISGDHTPLHVDEEYARKSHFGERVAHGLFGLSVADGLKCQSDYRFLPGMSLGWNWDFLLPIKIGDTLHVKFRVGEHAGIEEQARLGHRDHPVRAHQPERRSGPAR